MSTRSIVIYAVLSFATRAGAQSTFELAPGQKVLAPLQYQQLALFPIVKTARSGPPSKQFLTLAAGLGSHQVQVTEAPGGATVNRVNVANRSQKPLMLLAGEIILGGQQDRILGKDTIVPPGQEQPVEVYCVEHGRWAGRREFTVAGGIAEPTTRAKARFESNQSQVWAEVAKTTSALHAGTPTGTYRSLATGPQGEAAVRPYREQLTRALKALPESKQMIGFIAALNGRISDIELFADPDLFASYRDRLLDALYVTAAALPKRDQAPLPMPSEVRKFMHAADASPAAPVVDNEVARTTENKAGQVKKSTLIFKDKPAAPLYQSYQAE